jgi:pSer/pThr/pTyr-binding forkhead associated (FHA) protein
MSDFLDRIKRLFAPRPRPPAEPIGEATTDRPPPRSVDATPIEAVPTRAPIAEPTRAPVAEPTREPIPTPTRETIAEPIRERADLDELAEVRAALEAVAETQVSAPEPESEVVPPAAREPIPEPLFPQTPTAATVSGPADSTPEDAVEAPMLADTAEAEALAEVPEAAETAAAAAAPPTAVGRAGEALVLTLGSPPLTFTVTKTSATLGRGQENTIRLDDLSVSRRHARIAYRQGGYWLSDLGSMGGTWVNGTRLAAPRRLAFGEVIDIGLLRLTVGFAGGPAQAEESKIEKTVKPQINRSAKPRSEIAGQARRRR